MNNRKRIRKVVISAPHPSNFQKEKMREAIMNGDIVDLLKLAREMDECCNLAAELIDHSLKYFNFWTARVLDSLSVCRVCRKLKVWALYDMCRSGLHTFSSSKVLKMNTLQLLLSNLMSISNDQV